MSVSISVRPPRYANSSRYLVVATAEDGIEVFHSGVDLHDAKQRARAAQAIADKTGENPGDIERRLSAGRDASASQPPPKGKSPADCPYEATPDGLVWHRETANGAIPTLLTTFTATIVSEVVEDDGAETRRLLEIEATMRGQSYRFQVPASQYSGMNWPMEHLGGSAIVMPGQGARDHARAAIQMLSGKIPSRRVYSHTGWREIGGTWKYLHGGGAIGPGGADGGVELVLPPGLAGYHLPALPEGEALAGAVRASLEVLRVAGDRVTFPAYCATWRAALGGADLAVHLVGQTGAGKTEVAALNQQHYGAGMDARHLPGSWLSTGNALGELAFLVKDTLLAVDDFCPGGSQHDVLAMHRQADRLFRGQGNSAGRQRLRPDGSLRPVRPPRGLILSTGEDVPRGQSLRARLLVVEVPKDGLDAVDWGKLTGCQRDAAAGLYAAAMAGYLRWLAPQYGAVRQRLKEEVATLRAQGYQSNLHRRTADIAANLAVGFRWFLAFAQEVGAVTQEDADVLWERCWSALGEAAEAQQQHQADSDPVQRFLDLLAAAIASGRAHLADGDGEAPKNATAWGWEERVHGTGEYAETRWHHLGERIGWYEGGEIYLDADSAFAVAQRLARDGGDAIAITLPTLKRRLKERGLLASTEKAMMNGREVERLEIRKVLQGKRRKVLHINKLLGGCTSPESAPSVPCAPFPPKSYLAGDQKGRENGAHPGASPQNVCHESAPPPAAGLTQEALELLSSLDRNPTAVPFTVSSNLHRIAIENGIEAPGTDATAAAKIISLLRAKAGGGVQAPPADPEYRPGQWRESL